VCSANEEGRIIVLYGRKNRLADLRSRPEGGTEGLGPGFTESTTSGGRVSAIGEGCGIRRLAWLIAAILLLLAVPGCAGWWDSESDKVRVAVISYELENAPAPIDDLVIRLSPGEFRADYGGGSRMVWLVSNSLERRYREGEYFKVRDPQRSYLFVQDIRYDGPRTRALVRTVLYDASHPPVTKELELAKMGDGWQVNLERMVDSA